jgi:hypothetical protein
MEALLHPAIPALIELMPPPEDAGEQIDWRAVEDAWGTSFPDDYRDFMAVYGSGSINGYLFIGAPYDPAPEDHYTMSLTELSAVVPYANEFTDEQQSVYPEPNGLISWMTNSQSDHAFWRVDGNNPGKWSTVVLSRGSVSWLEFDLGMADFLLKLLTADFPKEPMGGSSAGRVPKFLTWREVNRLRSLGQNPWAHPQ